MFARFFVDRPVFATVISVVIVIVGLVALVMLPIAQYPEIAPPTITVTASYPGANAKVVADTVATPIEQEVNGVENMLYMSSRCTNDGQMTLDVTFKLGTNLDMAQVLVQNRVAIAEAKLPEEVKRQGVTTKKKSPSILLCVNLISEKETDPKTGKEHYKYDQLYLSNYATIQIKDALARIDGVGDVQFLGPRDYSMRIWLDPEKLASRNMTAGDVTNAIRKQNVQVAAGRLGQPPDPGGPELPVPPQHAGPARDGRAVPRHRRQDRRRRQLDLPPATWSRTTGTDQKGVELGAKNYDVNSYLDGEPSITLAIFQLPGSNALKTADAIKKKMEELDKRFPAGHRLPHRLRHDRLHRRIDPRGLQDALRGVHPRLHRRAGVPAGLAGDADADDRRAGVADRHLRRHGALGFSLNNLSLFGLVLAIGIVVDDAIVVVENVERWMAKGLPPREATIKAMDEITGPVIAITLVLSSVFIPTAFIAGISGQFFKQFALTIAASTIISAINAMTMAPARAVTLIKPHAHGHDTREKPCRAWRSPCIGGLAGLSSFWCRSIAHHVRPDPSRRRPWRSRRQPQVRLSHSGQCGSALSSPAASSAGS